MKPLPLSLIAASSIFIVGLPKPAQALPFKTNCASMQSYFNKIRWEESTKFSGFESKTMRPVENLNGIKPNSGACTNGYITLSSPMGTRVCKGTMWYSDGSSSFSVNEGECRWK